MGLGTVACTRMTEVDSETALAMQIDQGSSNREAIISRCLIRPGKERNIGSYGGYWNMRLDTDPMTFNTLTARDAASRAAIDWLSASTVEYDPFSRKWSSGLVDFRVENDVEGGIQRIFCTLRKDALWYLPSTGETIPITSRDVVFWFNEIEGDIAVQHPGYASQFVQIEDGTLRPITIEAIDSRTYVYTFPRISSDPVLEISGVFGPYFIFQPVKQAAYDSAYAVALANLVNSDLSIEEKIEKAGEEAASKAAAAINNIQSINVDPKTLPTCGPFYIDEYQPGIKIVLRRNPHYYLRDSNKNVLPYVDGLVYHIIRDEESAILEFLSGTTDTTGIPHDKLERMFSQQERKVFDIYFGGASLSSGFVCLNQNPVAMNAVRQRWFFQKEFRQGISCLINREELINQIYLGLGVANDEFFNKANSMYNPNIRMGYGYDPVRAMELFEGIGMKLDDGGVLRDDRGIAVEFGFSFGADNDVVMKTASIISHNLEKGGIRVNLEPTDFQKIVNSLLKTFDWEMTSVALGGNYWPSGGSNVWQSSGNFHLWHPNQPKPVTLWEGEVDRLYNEGRFAANEKVAREAWDSYQRLILEEMPIIYLPYPYSFRAFQTRWGNITYDLLGGYDSGVDIRYVYLK